MIVRENVEVENVIHDGSLAFLRLLIGQVTSVHVVVEEERKYANVDRNGQDVWNGDPEISVEVKQQHPDNRRPGAEPTIGLVQVLQQEIGEQSSANEEERVN